MEVFVLDHQLLAALVAGLCFCGAAPAAPLSARATAGVDLQARLKEVERDPKLSESLVKMGAKVAAICDSCHGEGGNSLRTDIPNLASQNPIYHLEQLRQYAIGQRRDRFMEGMIKAMNSEEKVGMVMFYATQKVSHKPVQNAALVAKGKVLYEDACEHCHSEDGHGDEKLARIAGQQSVYLNAALKRYRAGTGVRLDARMAANTKKMTDADINALVAYTMSMQ